MARSLTALFVGAIFGVGLAVSGMMNPAKVLGFLDIAGGTAWDPTLIFVMVGALLVTVPAFRLVLKRTSPVLDQRFDLPTKTALDGRLLGGSALFGVGWVGPLRLLPRPRRRRLAARALVRARAGPGVRGGDACRDGALPLVLREPRRREGPQPQGAEVRGQRA
jgi:hypothetical protein